MKALRSLSLALAALSTLALHAPGHAQAQAAYPDRPVKVIVALPAGGSVDMVARVLGQKMADQLGQKAGFAAGAGAHVQGRGARRRGKHQGRQHG